MKYDIESIQRRKKNSKIIKRIFNVILIIIIYNLVLVAFSYINKIENVNIFGYRAYIITTSSMQPTIKEGDIVICKVVEEDKIEEGDVITFRQNQDVITHRVIKIQENEENKYYITKGDNNNLEDSEKVEYNMIEGNFVIKIPYLGKIINIMQDRIILLLIVLVLLILCLINIRKEEKKDSRREKKKIEEEKQLKN